MSGRLAPVITVSVIAAIALVSPTVMASTPSSGIGGQAFSGLLDSDNVPQGGQSAGSSIRVEGNERIETETILSYMVGRSGPLFTDADIDASIKALYATGLFADVAIVSQGEGVTVRVVENPIINRIAFEGNKRIEDKTLEPELQLKPRQVFTQGKVQEDVQRILDIYRRSGRYAVSVEPKVIERDQNRVDLVFEISEGPSTYIRRVNFVGNKNYSDSILKEEIASREERWYRFFSSVDTYDPDRMSYDRELLRRFYLREGYADFRIISGVAELLPDQSGFFMTFTLDEGERYKFGSLKLDVQLPGVSPEDLGVYIQGVSGDWYNADEIESSIQSITEAIGAMGYAFVDVSPRVRRDKEAQTIDVVYEVQEGPRVFIERLDITGNVRTLDRVIRREITLAEGDAFNTAKLRRSRERIRNLGFFSRVEVSSAPSETAPDRTVVQVDVAEQATGNMQFALGWSSMSGVMFSTSLQERNLLGRGQGIDLSLSVGEKKQEIDFSFTEPYFMGRPLAAGLDVFNRMTSYQDQSSYNFGELGFGLRFGFNYTERWRQSLSYTLSQSNVTNVKDSASSFIKKREGKSLFSSIGQSVSYDRRDSIIDPHEGYFMRLSNEFAGIGGDEKYVSATFEGRNYFSLGDDVVWGMGGTLGYITGLGQDVRYYRNYTLGGENLRGFEYGGASPRDKKTGDVLGGNWVAVFSSELQFPLGLPEELGIRGKIFADVGMIGKPDGVLAADMDSSLKARASVGVGLLWRSPIGAISIHYAEPIVKEKFDKEEKFQFGVSNRF